MVGELTARWWLRWQAQRFTCRLSSTRKSERTTEFTQSVLRAIPQQTVGSVDSHRSIDPLAEVKPVKSSGTKLEVKKTIFTPKLSAVIPYIEIASVNHQYTEHGQQWMRLDFAHARKLCRKVAMSLPSKAQWSELMQARPFVNDAWPQRIPYWGQGIYALYPDDTEQPMTKGSLLNVVCVKPHRSV